MSPQTGDKETVMTTIENKLIPGETRCTSELLSTSVVILKPPFINASIDLTNFQLTFKTRGKENLIILGHQLADIAAALLVHEDDQG